MHLDFEIHLLKKSAQNYNIYNPSMNFTQNAVTRLTIVTINMCMHIDLQYITLEFSVLQDIGNKYSFLMHLCDTPQEEKYILFFFKFYTSISFIQPLNF